MFEPKLNTEKFNVVQVRHVEKRKYIKALKGLRNSEFYSLRSEALDRLNKIHEFVETILSEIKNKSIIDKYNNQQCKAMVADAYFNFIKLNRSSESLEIICNEILSIIDKCSVEFVNDKTIDEISQVSLRIQSIINSYCEHFVNKDAILQNEKDELSQDFSKEEELYELYKSIKKQVKKIKSELDVDVPLNTFITIFNKNYMDYLDNKENSYQDFSRFISVQNYKNSEGEDLVSKRKKYEEIWDLLHCYAYGVDYDCILENLNYRLFIDKESEENIKNKISTLISELEKNNSTFFAQYIKSLNNVIKNRNYKMLIKIIRNCEYAAYSECSNLEEDVFRIFDKAIKEKSSDLPYLRFLKGKKKKYYKVIFKRDEKMKDIFNTINILNVLFNSLESISEDNIEYYIKYFCKDELKITLRIIDIIDEIKAIVPIDEFVDYIEYFKYIDGKYELSEQEVVDETIKRYIIANKSNKEEI